MDLTTAWAEVEEEVLVWSLVGTQVELWKQEGALVSVAASSKVNLLNLLTESQASAFHVGLGPRSVRIIILMLVFALARNNGKVFPNIRGQSGMTSQSHAPNII